MEGLLSSDFISLNLNVTKNWSVISPQVYEKGIELHSTSMHAHIADTGDNFLVCLIQMCLLFKQSFNHTAKLLLG